MSTKLKVEIDDDAYALKVIHIKNALSNAKLKLVRSLDDSFIDGRAYIEIEHNKMGAEIGISSPLMLYVYASDLDFCKKCRKFADLINETQTQLMNKKISRYAYYGLTPPTLWSNGETKSTATFQPVRILYEPYGNHDIICDWLNQNGIDTRLKSDSLKAFERSGFLVLERWATVNQNSRGETSVDATHCSKEFALKVIDLCNKFNTKVEATKETVLRILNIPLKPIAPPIRQVKPDAPSGKDQSESNAIRKPPRQTIKLKLDRGKVIPLNCQTCGAPLTDAHFNSIVTCRFCNAPNALIIDSHPAEQLLEAQ